MKGLAIVAAVVVAVIVLLFAVAWLMNRRGR